MVTYRLALVKDSRASLLHHGTELLPGIAFIPRPVDCSRISLNKDDFVGVAAPQDVDQLVVDFEYIETNFVCIYCLHLVEAHR